MTGWLLIAAGLSETSASLKFGGCGSGSESNAWALRGAGFAAPLQSYGGFGFGSGPLDVRGRVGEPEEERLRLRRAAVDEVDRLRGEHVLQEVGGLLAVLGQGAVVVERVVVDQLPSPGPPRATPTSPAAPVCRFVKPSGTCRSGRCSSRRPAARPRGCCSRAAPRNAGSRRSAGCCPRTPWLCAYWPVRNVARDGQQSEKLTKLFLNVAPLSPISELTLIHDPHRLDRLIVRLDHDHVGP